MPADDLAPKRWRISFLHDLEERSLYAVHICPECSVNPQTEAKLVRWEAVSRHRNDLDPPRMSRKRDSEDP